MVRTRIHLLVMILTVVVTMSRAEDIRVSAKVDSNNVLIGDWIPVHFEIRHLSSVQVQWPLIADSLEGFEIVRRDTPVVKTEAGNTLETCTFILTAFDSGTKVIPPLPFGYHTAGDTALKVAETSPIPIFVHGIALDSTKEIKDIKAPLSVPITFLEMLPYLLGVVVLCLIIWLIFYIRKKLSRGESIIPTAPPRPEDEVALEALRSLESEHVWQRGKVKEYYSALTDIVRTYIERRYSVIAMEMTSDEILSARAISSLSKETFDRLRELLLRADLVKFAKHQPVAQDHEVSMVDAVAFVETTRREAVPETQPVEQVNAQ